MSKNDAYTAGLFDGEGTVTLMRTHKNSHRVPYVEMSSTTIELLDYLSIHYGGSVVKKKSYQSHHKTSWSWRLTNQKAMGFLREIRPYLLEPMKCARADAILTRYNVVTNRNGKYTTEQLEEKSRFETDFFSLDLP